MNPATQQQLTRAKALLLVAQTLALGAFVLAFLASAAVTQIEGLVEDELGYERSAAKAAKRHVDTVLDWANQRRQHP